MNKQEQIEKMATILACGNCGQCSWDCPEDEGLNAMLKKRQKPKASLLASKGYINGADFVDWLKNKYKAEYDRWKGVAISIRIDDIEELLQEYLKGE